MVIIAKLHFTLIGKTNLAHSPIVVRSSKAYFDFFDLPKYLKTIGQTLITN